MGIQPLGGRTLKVLSEKDIQMVTETSIEILKDPGFKIQHEEALNLFDQAGAEVDFNKQMVHIPQFLVEKALSSAPRSITVCGREPVHDLKSYNGVHFSGGHGATFIRDIETGERRPAVKKDLENNVLIHDALENTHIIFPEIYPQDVPEKSLDRHISQALLNNTVKPVIATAYDGAGARDLINMGIAIAGSREALQKRPMFTCSFGMISPFVYEPARIDALMEMARFNLPFQIYTIPGAGTSAPVTLAGTLALSVAELLSGLILTQIVNPGAPVRLMGYAGSSDMRSGDFTFASPETTLMAGGLAQILQAYGVPHAVHGSTTRSNALDAQVGYETGMLNLFSALSGTDIVIEATSSALENTETSYPEQSIIGNEICSFINRILKGIEVNRDTLALDVIRQVGAGGEFLTNPHTMEHFREEQWDSQLGNRIRREAWEKQGAKDIQARAKDRLKQILETHRPKPLESDVQRKIQKIVDNADA
jgi:trimethylamine--corrinoid protein Co-methyltransferase